MTNEYQDLHEGLSEHERAAIREELRVLMRAHPARAPFLLRALDSFEAIIYQPRMQFGAATAALVLVMGTGTAFAAQNALPGEPLYGIKVNVEEPIAGSFATSPEAKANWSTQLAGRRITEAEQLASQNKLTTSAASTIADGLNQATESFDANVAQLATSSNGSAAAAGLESTMEATLATNSEVMSQIANAVPSAAGALTPILTGVHERAVASNAARTQYDIAAAGTNVAQIKAAAQAQLDSAEGQVNSIQLTAEAITASASSSAVQQAQAAKANIRSGQQNLAAGNYVAALETSQVANVEAHAAQLNVSVGAPFEGQGTTSTSSVSASSGIPALQATSTATTSTSTQASTTRASYRRDQ